MLINISYLLSLLWIIDKGRQMDNNVMSSNLFIQLDKTCNTSVRQKEKSRNCYGIDHVSLQSLLPELDGIAKPVCTVINASQLTLNAG